MGHAEILRNLDVLLRRSGWRDIEEIPSAVDLWGTAPNGERVLFEAKTITAETELTRCRSALAQLLEYRLEYAAPDDRICVAIDHALSVRRARVLSELGVAVLVVDDEGYTAGNDAASELAELLTQD